METEKFVVYQERRKLAADKRRIHNPNQVYPNNFKPLAVLEFEPGSAKRVLDNDQAFLQKLRDRLGQEEWEKDAGPLQIRVARGGVGSGRHMSVKAMIKSGAISTQGKGFQVILRNFEV